jgi:hypothetical protein
MPLPQYDQASNEFKSEIPDAKREITLVILQFTLNRSVSIYMSQNGQSPGENSKQAPPE